MSSKYECRFFPNGRVVFVPTEDIENAIHARKELLVICNSWSGGYAIAIGAEERQDYEEPDKTCWDMYSYDIRDKEFTAEDFQKFYKVIFSSGERIMMKTGDEATMETGGNFIDWDTKKPHDVTDEQWDKMRKTVDAQFTVNMLRNDEKAECLSHYGVGIEWTGTKFERKYA